MIPNGSLHRYAKNNSSQISLGVVIEVVTDLAGKGEAVAVLFKKNLIEVLSITMLC